MKSVNLEIANAVPDLSKRSCGVLMHVTSLPGKYGVGDLGPAAFEWIDMLAAAGQRWWQMLPLGPCGEGNSPYRSYSAFAGNPLLISPDALVRSKLLTAREISAMSLPPGRVNYTQAGKNKMAMLAIAYQRFIQKPNASFKRFILDNREWLDDFALFMALRETMPETSWTQWPKALRSRTPSALKSARNQFKADILLHQFTQFIFFQQLRAVRDHARRAGVALIGDLPIFVSPESADVWTNPQLFQLNSQGQPRAVAGVPPDLFSPTGQCWGNPLYDWKAMRANKFAWWKARLKSALVQADLVRIDHFRGFESYWRIPAGSATAENGRWVKGPGAALFAALTRTWNTLPLLAEDLGIITPEVERLRDQFKLPGMRVLQFGFSDDGTNPHTPHNFVPHAFGYTGTHDNETTAGWFASLPSLRKRYLEKYAPAANWNASPTWSMIRILLASSVNHAIVPLQDLLELSNAARMNTPGKSDDNWEWRVNGLSECKTAFKHLANLSSLYGRTVRKM